jgi:hypothetical protein
MDVRMKTTLNIDDKVMAELKREAAHQGRTMSELVETALRLLLQGPKPRRTRLPPQPKFHSGGALVDMPIVMLSIRPWKAGSARCGCQRAALGIPILTNSPFLK